MERTEIHFATDDNGCPVTVPGKTKRFRILRHKRGKVGRPGNVYRGRKPFEVAVDVTSAELGQLPSGDYCADALDEKGHLLGERIYFSIEHLDEEPQLEGDDGRADEAPRVDRQSQFLIDQLQAMVQELHGMLKESMEMHRKTTESALQACVEMTKCMPKVVEASTQMLETAQGGGLSKAADEVRKIWETAPEGDNNLETVLNSPVVMGAAHAIQKYVANAAQSSAEAMAAQEHGPRSENMASKVARAVRAADLKAEREAARQGQL